MSSELAYMSATELSRAIRSRQASSVEVTELFYERIERLDPRLNSYLALCPEQALSDARAADDAVARGWALGPLHGIPISIKDLEMSKGIPTTLGSALFRDRIPEIDSIVVERVKAAGAVVLGKTNTPEFGQSGTTENKVSEPCRNPWNTPALRADPAAGQARHWPLGCAPSPPAATAAVPYAYRPASAGSSASSPPSTGSPATAATGAPPPITSRSPAR